jgi:hypothetical protein
MSSFDTVVCVIKVEGGKADRLETPTCAKLIRAQGFHEDVVHATWVARDVGVDVHADVHRASPARCSLGSTGDLGGGAIFALRASHPNIV